MDNIVLLIAFFGLIYFMMIRPQQKQQQKRKSMLDSLQVNDKIVTIGGIQGIIKALREDNLVIEIAENVEITILRTAVGHVIEEEDEEINEDEEIEEDGEIEEESTEK
ncbi:MAG: preprotein translocase subunit YajC [Clostridia bacterium]|nr:preprotein translocase subunit YajC [Clostridia bacterium]